MKIWICGSRGMLGSHFTKLLKERQIDYVESDITSSEHCLDITHLNDVLNFASSQKISHIINCAAYTAVDKAETDRELALQVNALGPRHLGIASKKLNLHVVHYSTDYVFDGKGSAPYQEDHVCSPVNYYGVSKWEGEKALIEETARYCIIRTSWLYGLQGKNFVETMLKLMQEKETLRIVSDQVGRPTFCQDLAEATLKLLDHAGIYHFANSNETSWHGFAQEIYQIALKLGYPLKIKNIQEIPSHKYPTPAKRPAYSTLDTTKIERILRDAPRSWQLALKDYLMQIQKV